MTTQVTVLYIRAHIFLHDMARPQAAQEEGQDMVEYALLAGILSIASVAVAILIGPYLRNMYGDVLNAWQHVT
ncbi:MAG TPA: hypothetical protein VF221_00275 [Chloroflexota bacterium]